jgi:nucleoside-diphosphate-sugar epimerase
VTTVAITGGTGFVGGHLLRIAGERGLVVRALARRAQPDLAHVRWIEGALDRLESLATLAAGADAVIHVAGTINAPARAGFEAGNIVGTAAMIEAAKAAGVRRFIHVSSLAAREPALSDYGWSKKQSEALVAASGLDWTIVRPPAVYGPGDREMLELFRLAARGIVPLPPAGRLSLIEAGDLSRLLLDLMSSGESFGATYEPDDEAELGWDHRDFARALGEAVGRRVLPISMPAGLLRLASAVEGVARRGKAKLTPDRVRYFCHADWVVSAHARPPLSLWRPEVETREGLRTTASWYRAQGWL